MSIALNLASYVDIVLHATIWFSLHALVHAKRLRKFLNWINDKFHEIEFKVIIITNWKNKVQKSVFYFYEKKSFWSLKFKFIYYLVLILEFYVSFHNFIFSLF